MMTLHFSTFRTALAATLLLTATPILAQDAEPAPDETAAEPIIVIGEETDPDRPKRKVMVGSRIPRTPTFHEGTVATSTGTRGLVPQSGMDQGSNFTRKIIKRSCVADSDAISGRAACLLIKSDEAFAADDQPLGRAYLSAIVREEEAFSAAERHQAALRLYGNAKTSGNDVHLTEAMEMLLEIGELTPVEKGGALRNLVSLDLAANDRAGAIERLEQLQDANLARPQDIANRAILMRQTKLPGSGAIMGDAIAAQKAAGQTVPKGWQDFAAAPG